MIGEDHVGGASGFRTLRVIRRLIYSQARLHSGLPLHAVLQCLKRRMPRNLFLGNLVGLLSPTRPLRKLGATGSLPSRIVRNNIGVLPTLLLRDFLCVCVVHWSCFRDFVDSGRVELPTSRVSDVRSNRLSYESNDAVVTTPVSILYMASDTWFTSFYSCRTFAFHEFCDSSNQTLAFVSDNWDTEI